MVLLFVKTMEGKVLSVDIPLKSTVAELKDIIGQLEHTSINNQKLIFAGQVLKDDVILSEYNITKECSIQLFISKTRDERKQQLVLREPSAGSLINVRPRIVSEPLSLGDLVIVRLVEAKNLERADFWTRSSDPYVIFVFGSCSSKSKTIKRNLNPVWNEVFGFKIEENNANAVLSMIVFDFDNFTPDDFIGSSEIDLSQLERGKLYDLWVSLDNVKTGQVHLQIQRNIITSPKIHQIISSLIALERSWNELDLRDHGISLLQLSGRDVWVSQDERNPALDHLKQSVREGSIQWDLESLERVRNILRIQNVLPFDGRPTRHLWVSNLSIDFTAPSFIELFSNCGKVKHVHFMKGLGFSIVTLASISDSVLSLVDLQYTQVLGRRMDIGFGRFIPHHEDTLCGVLKGGFLNVSFPPKMEWICCWVFLKEDELDVYCNLMESKPELSISTDRIFVCSQGIYCIEVFDTVNKYSCFIRSENEVEVEEWKNLLRNPKRNQVMQNNNDFTCSICYKFYSINKLYIRECGVSRECIGCLRKRILDAVEHLQKHSLVPDFSIEDIRELLTPSEFEKYLELTLVELFDRDNRFIKCPSCGFGVEFIEGDQEETPNVSKLIGINRKPLSSQALQHFMQNRCRCRNFKCSANFCRKCDEIPYHSGFDCELYQVYKNADHCRFCDVALMPGMLALNAPSPSLSKVCNAEECIAKRDQSCTKTLPCKCPCGGVLGEMECLPCLKEGHGVSGESQTMNDFCSICFTESLKSSPCVLLDCGHVFHYECILKRLDEEWSSPQITFAFACCPLCNLKISHEMLSEKLIPIQNLYRDIEQKSFERAEYENLLSHTDITSPDGKYYGNAAGFALDYFAFYMCFKCKKPYFGGQPRCNDGLDRFDPSELICGSCSGVGLEECPDHGKDGVVFKCRFCCSPSSWYCWGTTHFCDNCHRRQEAHDFMTTKTQDELDQCPGPDKCPLKIEHPPNGTEFSLGCSLCKGSAP